MYRGDWKLYLSRVGIHLFECIRFVYMWHVQAENAYLNSTVKLVV